MGCNSSKALNVDSASSMPHTKVVPVQSLPSSSSPTSSAASTMPPTPDASYGTHKEDYHVIERYTFAQPKETPDKIKSGRSRLKKHRQSKKSNKTAKDRNQRNEQGDHNDYHDSYDEDGYYTMPEIAVISNPYNSNSNGTLNPYSANADAYATPSQFMHHPVGTRPVPVSQY